MTREHSYQVQKELPCQPHLVTSKLGWNPYFFNTSISVRQTFIHILNPEPIAESPAEGHCFTLYLIERISLLLLV
jgi:hypothetical protein